MSKIVFIVPPLAGHLNPTLGFGAGLIAKGHEVSWIGVDHADIGKRLPQGGRFLEIPSAFTEDNKKDMEAVKDTLQSGMFHGLESLKYGYEMVMIPFNNYMLDKTMKILDDNPVDLIISDQHVLAGSVAATLKKIPYATSLSTPATIQTSDLLLQLLELETGHVLSFQQKAGIPGNERLDVSRLMSFVYTSELFFGNFKIPDYYKFIGPVITPGRDKIDFDWEKLHQMPDRPKILVSVGTTFVPGANREFFDKVAEALGGEDYTVIAVSGKENFEHIPDNFIVQERVPQLDLLPLMDLVVCHGGFNTVSETLLEGKPVIVLPKAYDQSYVSSKITDSGTGIRLNSGRFRPRHLKDAVLQILSDGSYTENAKKIQQSFIQSGGIAKGVELVESLL